MDTDALKSIVEILIQVLGVALAIVAVWAVKRLASKYGVELDDAKLEMVRSVVKSGVNYADAWAKTRTVKPESSDKLHTALEFVNKTLQDTNVGKIAEEQIIKLIEAQLHFDSKNVLPGS